MDKPAQMHIVDKNSGNSFQIQIFVQHETVPADKFELQHQIFYLIYQTEFQQISQIGCNKIELVSKNMGLYKKTVHSKWTIMLIYIYSLCSTNLSILIRVYSFISFDHKGYT